VTADTPYVFQFTLTRTSCEPASGDLSIVPAYTFDGNQSGLQTGSATTLMPLLAASPTDVTVGAIHTEDFDLSVAFSFNPIDVSGPISYDVQATGCSEWSISMIASDFTLQGGAITIPAYLTTTSFSGEGVIPHEVSATQTGIGAIPLITAGASQWDDARFMQTLDLSLTLPAGAPAGEYTSTVIIDAASGP
jgi:hypothetical protein